MRQTRNRGEKQQRSSKLWKYNKKERTIVTTKRKGGSKNVTEDTEGEAARHGSNLLDGCLAALFSEKKKFRS